MALYRCGNGKEEPPLSAVNMNGVITISAWSVPFNAGIVNVPGSYTSPGVSHNVQAAMLTASVTINLSLPNARSANVNRSMEEALTIALDCASRNDTESEFYTGEAES